MPYIPKADRQRRNLAAMNVGELTYQIQQLIHLYLSEHGLRYQGIAEISGVLHQVQRDFDERVVEQYEKMKRAANGDVWDRRYTHPWFPTPHDSVESRDHDNTKR